MADAGSKDKMAHHMDNKKVNRMKISTIIHIRRRFPDGTIYRINIMSNFSSGPENTEPQQASASQRYMKKKLISR